EVHQPRFRELEPILQVRPELHYPSFRSIQLPEHTHRTLQGMALKNVLDVTFCGFHEGCKLRQGLSCEGFHRVDFVDICERGPPLVGHAHQQWMARLALEKNPTTQESMSNFSRGAALAGPREAVDEY